MSYVMTDERRRIIDSAEEAGEGRTWVTDDMRGWTLFDDGIPKYKLSEDNWVLKRTDAEMKRDRKGRK